MRRFGEIKGRRRSSIVFKLPVKRGNGLIIERNMCDQWIRKCRNPIIYRKTFYFKTTGELPHKLTGVPFIVLRVKLVICYG